MGSKILQNFGISDPEKKPQVLKSVDIERDDGSKEIVNFGGIFGLSTDLSDVPKNEVDLIRTYRKIAKNSDVEKAINEIMNEIFVFDDPYKKAVDITFNTTENEKRLKISDDLMNKIRAEFDMIYSILNFQRKGSDLFSSWYIDGRLFLHKIVDSKNQKNGIKKIIKLDPTKIRKIVEYPTPDQEGVYNLDDVKRYYIYSDANDVFGKIETKRVFHMTSESIAYSDCGIYDDDGNFPLSYLWKVITPFNNMKMMEDSLIVYRVVRSPERRVFYIGVGNLSKPKAEEYIRNLMNKFKSKLVYDSNTGLIVDRKNVMSMVEDYWIPRRDDGKGTEISTLQGGNALSSIDDVVLFQKKFKESLNVPASRLKDDEPNVVFGRTTEISRDEYRFRKFIDRLRNRFVLIFEDLLRTQLILKNIITIDDWDIIKDHISWVYLEDNNFVQWKEAELINSQIDSISTADNLVGKYFDRRWVLKNIMKKSDEEIDKMLKSVEETPTTDEDPDDNSQD